MNTRRFLVVGVCAVVSAFAVRVIVRSVEEAAPISFRVLKPGANIDAAMRAFRPNYPYSVIPGGAYSPWELRAVNQKDQLVRDHYSDFDLNAAQLVTLTADRYQYVSFRLKDKIYWTRNRLKIPKGEVLLTDGRHYARTRCGNRLSPVSVAQTTPLQPPDRLLALPPFSPDQLGKGVLQPAPAPPPGELAQQYPVLPFEAPRLAPYVPPETEASLRLPGELPPPESTFPVSPGFPSPGLPQSTPAPPSPHYTPPSPPVGAEVPEPASLALFGVALCISGWLLVRMVRANRRAEPEAKEGEK
jgi:PEP-CTERM motif